MVGSSVSIESVGWLQIQRARLRNVGRGHKSGRRGNEGRAMEEATRNRSRKRCGVSGIAGIELGSMYNSWAECE